MATSVLKNAAASLTVHPSEGRTTHPSNPNEIMAGRVPERNAAGDLQGFAVIVVKHKLHGTPV
jgi:hypothetical protein